MLLIARRSFLFYGVAIRCSNELYRLLHLAKKKQQRRLNTTQLWILG